MTDLAIINFRRAILPDDIEALCEFDRRAFGEYPDDLFTEEDWAELESYWMIVDGKTIGCVALKRDVDYDEESRPGCLYIESTGILPEYQGQGFGSKAKAWQIEYAKKYGYGVIVTNMRESNVRSMELNKKFGFQPREVAPHYYSEPDESALVMELRLGMKQ